MASRKDKALTVVEPFLPNKKGDNPGTGYKAKHGDYIFFGSFSITVRSIATVGRKKEVKEFQIENLTGGHTMQYLLEICKMKSNTKKDQETQAFLNERYFAIVDQQGVPVENWVLFADSGLHPGMTYDVMPKRYVIDLTKAGAYKPKGPPQSREDFGHVGAEGHPNYDEKTGIVMDPLQLHEEDQTSLILKYNKELEDRMAAGETLFEEIRGVEESTIFSTKSFSTAEIMLLVFGNLVLCLNLLVLFMAAAGIFTSEVDSADEMADD